MANWKPYNDTEAEYLVWIQKALAHGNVESALLEVSELIKYLQALAKQITNRWACWKILMNLDNARSLKQHLMEEY